MNQRHEQLLRDPYGRRVPGLRAALELIEALDHQAALAHPGAGTILTPDQQRIAAAEAKRQRKAARHRGTT